MAAVYAAGMASTGILNALGVDPYHMVEKSYQQLEILKPGIQAMDSQVPGGSRVVEKLYQAKSLSLTYFSVVSTTMFTALGLAKSNRIFSNEPIFKLRNILTRNNKILTSYHRELRRHYKTDQWIKNWLRTIQPNKKQNQMNQGNLSSCYKDEFKKKFKNKHQIKSKYQAHEKKKVNKNFQKSGHLSILDNDVRKRIKR